MFISKMLTIVIPCKNHSENIIKCLEYLNAQYKIKNTRIIIVDSSDNDIREIINKHNFKNIKIEIINGEETLSKSRNLGSDLVKTSYILFLDSDIFLKDIRTIDEVLKDLICFNYDLGTIRIRTAQNKYSYIFPMFEFFRDLFFNTPLCVGGFMMFNKECFDSLGRFDSESKVFEDLQLSMKVRPDKFHISNFIGHTSNEKFFKKGFFYFLILSIRSFLNKKNPSFFHKSHGYWD